MLQEQAAARAAQLLDNARNLRELKMNETLVVALDGLLAQDNLPGCPVPPTELRNQLLNCNNYLRGILSDAGISP